MRVNGRRLSKYEAKVVRKVTRLNNWFASTFPFSTDRLYVMEVDNTLVNRIKLRLLGVTNAEVSEAVRGDKLDLNVLAFGKFKANKWDARRGYVVKLSELGGGENVKSRKKCGAQTERILL